MPLCVFHSRNVARLLLLEAVAVGSREVSGITHVWSALLRLQGSCWGEEGGHDVRNPVQVRFALFLFI